MFIMLNRALVINYYKVPYKQLNGIALLLTCICIIVTLRPFPTISGRDTWSGTRLLYAMPCSIVVPEKVCWRCPPLPQHCHSVLQKAPLSPECTGNQPILINYYISGVTTQDLPKHQLFLL